VDRAEKIVRIAKSKSALSASLGGVALKFGMTAAARAHESFGALIIPRLSIIESVVDISCSSIIESVVDIPRTSIIESVVDDDNMVVIASQASAAAASSGEIQAITGDVSVTTVGGGSVNASHCLAGTSEMELIDLPTLGVGSVELSGQIGGNGVATEVVLDGCIEMESTDFPVLTIASVALSEQNVDNGVATTVGQDGSSDMPFVGVSEEMVMDRGSAVDGDDVNDPDFNPGKKKRGQLKKKAAHVFIVSPNVCSRPKRLEHVLEYNIVLKYNNTIKYNNN